MLIAQHDAGVPPHAFPPGAHQGAALVLRAEGRLVHSEQLFRIENMKILTALDKIGISSFGELGVPGADLLADIAAEYQIADSSVVQSGQRLLASTTLTRASSSPTVVS